jgi:hypothetical protein
MWLQEVQQRRMRRAIPKRQHALHLSFEPALVIVQEEREALCSHAPSARLERLRAVPVLEHVGGAAIVAPALRHPFEPAKKWRVLLPDIAAVAAHDGVP